MDKININSRLRYDELDILRGVSVILMVIFHFFYLYYILGKDLETINNPLVSILATISHSLFIFLFGINFYINYNKNKDKKKTEYYKKQIYKFLTYASIALGITFVTYYMFPDRYVKFGIFHFFAISIILANIFVTNKNHIILGIGLFVALYIFIFNNSKYYTQCMETPIFCFITGIKNVKYNSIDHFAIIPFFTIVLCGMYVGSNLYDNNKRNFNIGKLQKIIDSNLGQLLSLIGKYSLYIYIVHWVILYQIVKMIN